MWSVLRPFITIVVFTLVFNKLGNFHAGNGVPYAIMVCAGMLPWQFFSNAFGESAGSLVANSNLLTKVYFPRLIVPSSTIIVSLIDFFISFLILAGLFVYYQYLPGVRIFFLPLFLILATVTAMGSGLFIAALNVKYRDFRYVIPFIIQIGLYISPVGFNSQAVYSSEKIPRFLKHVYALNPMVAVIDGFRWSILGEKISGNLFDFCLSLAVSLVLLLIGIWYFRRMEKTFADII